MNAKNIVIATCFLSFSYLIPAKAVTVKNLTCTATHHSIGSDGSDSARIVGSNVKLRDIGTSFSVVIGGEKIISSSLIPIEKDGDVALAGEKDGVFYTKFDGNYVIKKGKDGYVISECK